MSSRVSPTTDAPGPAGPTRGYRRTVRVVRCDDGTLGLKVFGDAACRMRDRVERLLDELMRDLDRKELSVGDEVATLRLVPATDTLEFVTPTDWRAA